MCLIIVSLLLILVAGVHADTPSGRMSGDTVAAERQAQFPLSSPGFRTGTTMVTLNVIVTEDDDPVRGLTPADFQIYEDGVRQQVRFFDAGHAPLDLILLVDTSTSMRDDMPVLHTVAGEFMEMLRVEDRGAVMTFNERVRVIQELTSDKAAIQSAIRAITAYGSTALHTALYVTLKQVGQPSATGEVRRQAIAVLSDGEDTSSLVTVDDVVAQAQQSALTIYAIGLRGHVNAKAATYFSSPAYTLDRLARETGGRAFFPNTATDLKHVYRDIADELRAQYSLAYSPLRRTADGRFRRVEVRLPSHPHLSARARVGYVADPARLRR